MGYAALLHWVTRESSPIEGSTEEMERIFLERSLLIYQGHVVVECHRASCKVAVLGRQWKRVFFCFGIDRLSPLHMLVPE